MVSLSITPEVTQEYIPNSKSTKLIKEIAISKGIWEEYKTYQYGSSYYIELPAYIDKLINNDKLERAKEILLASFSGNGIPRELYQEIVRWYITSK